MIYVLFYLSKKVPKKSPRMIFSTFAGDTMIKFSWY